MCIYIYIYIHIHTHTYMHTYIHTYIHMYRYIYTHRQCVYIYMSKKDPPGGTGELAKCCIV